MRRIHGLPTIVALSSLVAATLSACAAPHGDPSGRLDEPDAREGPAPLPRGPGATPGADSAPPAAARAGPSVAHGSPGSSPMRVVEAIHGLQGRIEVLEHRGALVLAIDGVFQTVVPASPHGLAKGTLLRGGDHVELVPWFRPQARSALIVGLGGGLEARALALHGLRVTAVEIEPEVVRIARERFGVACETVVADGRAFLERDHRRFDAIVIDAFAGSDLPAHLFTREGLEAAARRLSPEGILVLHLVGRRRHPAIAAVARTLQAVFPHLSATRSGGSARATAPAPTGSETSPGAEVPSGLDARLEHLYLFASPEPLALGPWVRAELERLGLAPGAFTTIDSEGAPVLSDARNDLSALARDIGEEHRRMSLEIRRSPPW